MSEFSDRTVEATAYTGWIAEERFVLPTGTRYPEAEQALSIHAAIPRALEIAGIEGVTSVRILPGDDDTRSRERRHKIFFILGTHDIRRDRRIIEIMTQFSDADYDLVPEDAADLVPDGAEEIR